MLASIFRAVVVRSAAQRSVFFFAEERTFYKIITTATKKKITKQKKSLALSAFVFPTRITCVYSILFSCLVCVRACYNLHCAVFCFFRHSPSLPLRIRLCLWPGSVFVSFSLCASQIDVASLCTRTRTRFRFSSCSVRFSSVQFVWSGSILNYSSCETF